MSSQHAELRHGSNVRVSFFSEALRVRRRQSPIYTQQATPHPEPSRVGLTNTAEARVAPRPAAPATPSPITACAGTEKTDKRAPPETRYRRTRQKQPLYPKESDASITGTVVEFDP